MKSQTLPRIRSLLPCTSQCDITACQFQYSNTTLTAMFKQNHILPRGIACYISLLIGGRLSIITDCTPSAHRHAWCQCSVASHCVWLGDTPRFTRTAYWCCKYRRLSHLAPELCNELNNKNTSWPKVKVERTALHISKTNRNSRPEDDYPRCSLSMSSSNPSANAA
jgi:hypothetical protein